MIETQKSRPYSRGGSPGITNQRHFDDKPVHSLPASQSECPTCGASVESIEWRDVRREPNEFAHAVHGRMVPFCSSCDRPWFRGSRDNRLWTGAVA